MMHKCDIHSPDFSKVKPAMAHAYIIDFPSLTTLSTLNKIKVPSLVHISRAKLKREIHS